MPTDSPDARRGTQQALSARSDRDHRVVVALLLAAVVVVIALATVTVRATVQTEAVRQRVGGTLQRTSLQQMEFHSRNQRFADWGELEARGVRLPPSLRLEASSATASHWYLRLRDVESGTSCDRIGLLTDPPGRPLLPTCTRSP